MENQFITIVKNLSSIKLSFAGTMVDATYLFMPMMSSIDSGSSFFFSSGAKRTAAFPDVAVRMLIKR